MKSWNDVSLDEGAQVIAESRRGRSGCMRAVGLTLVMGCIAGFWGFDWFSARFGNGVREAGNVEVTEQFEWSKVRCEFSCEMYGTGGYLARSDKLGVSYVQLVG
jgi:hypothetical protein